MVTYWRQSRFAPAWYLQIITTFFDLHPHFVISPVNMKIIQIFLTFPSSIHQQRISLMQHHNGMFSQWWRVSFDFLSFPVVTFQIETPQPCYILILSIVFTSEHVHHIIEDRSRMSIDVLEFEIIQKMCRQFTPLFTIEIVTIHLFLLQSVVFR